MKIYAISDIHGHLHEFEYALSLIDLSSDAALVLLGDYIHGPESYAVLDRILALQRQFGEDKVIALLGNHEEMALEGYQGIGDAYDECAEGDDRYLDWIARLPLYHVVKNAIFVHAGIDEEAAAEGLWEWGTGEHLYTSKYPAETGKIENFDMKIVAGHIGTCTITEDPRFHDIFFDGGSHYYIDGSVQQSGELPILMYDTDTDQFFQVRESILQPILPYGED